MKLREPYRGSHECSQTYIGARAKSLKNAYAKTDIEMSRRWPVGLDNLCTKRYSIWSGPRNNPNNQNYWCDKEYWMVQEVTNWFRKLMHRMQSKINGSEDKTKWIKIPLQIIWIIVDGLEGTKPVRMKKKIEAALCLLSQRDLLRKNNF